jgi:hypothetical protein
LPASTSRKGSLVNHFVRLMVATVVATTSVAALAQDWRLVGRDDGRSDFVDVSTVRRSGATVQFRTERRLDAPFNVGGPVDIDLVTELYEADCDALTYAPLQRAAYLSRRLVVPSYSPNEPVRTARPGTVIAALIQFACASRT